MPIYVCHCPDYPNSLDKRLSVREAHLKDAGKDKEDGVSLFGRAFLTPEYSTSSVNPAPAVPAGQPNPGMAGSVMILKFPTIEACWDRLKRDKYWEAGVWDKEKTTVVELIAAPGDEDKRDL
ncbi:hypothetical protein QFC21_001201 [Naganishia friedmannii]|uniref:Uncharacterized protein n=1 Tax=Naganishia friedmannii TaxID=89922 RepID=A0ACC2W7J2_9TREE|nr:hypothetical protein QFC21_001201 [Naganishia friedmannii]